MDNKTSTVFALWGCGMWAERAYVLLKGIDIRLVIDSNATLHQTYWHDLEVISFDEYKKRKHDYCIIVTPDQCCDILKTLNKANYKNYLLLSWLLPLSNNHEFQKCAASLEPTQSFCFEPIVKALRTVFFQYMHFYELDFFYFLLCGSKLINANEAVKLLQNSPNTITSINEQDVLEPLRIISKKTFTTVPPRAFPQLSDNVDVVVIHGLNFRFFDRNFLIDAIKYNTTLLVEEDGFLRSVLPFGSNGSLKYKLPHSVILDKDGLYINAYVPSSIENVLNSNKQFSEIELLRSKLAIEKIRKNRLSKYNHVKRTKIKGLLAFKTKVLIVDQVRKDKSITFGMADESTFSLMLKSAIEENPKAQIIIKVHPVDSLGHFAQYKNDERILFIDYDINPIALLDAVDKVYVCTSQMGFEALMCGKEVHVFGMPFYAGWGITIDYLKCPRRKKTRTVEEVFFAAYILCTIYVSHQMHEVCEIEQVINELIDLRDEYFALSFV